MRRSSKMPISPTKTALFLALIATSTLAQTPATQPALQFSSPDTTTTPKGNITFHGPFNRDILYITAETPNPHEFLEISFDLLILRTWDGSVPITAQDEKPGPGGPDFLRVGLHKGPTLMYTTF